MRTRDRAAIERNLSLAIDATRQAMVLDPTSQDARILLADRTRLLVELRTPKPR